MKYIILLMNRTKQFAAVLFLTLCSLFIFSCNWENKPSDYKSFAYDLQGTWETHSISEYSGTLVISRNTITISGYAPNTFYEWSNGTSHRPFRDFLKDTLLEGYAEEEKIYISDAGTIQAGIPYTYWEGPLNSDYTRDQFLRFDFGGRVETLRKK